MTAFERRAEVPDSEGWYEVSTEGRVRSWVNRGGKSKRTSPLIRKPHLNKDTGYHKMCLKVNGIRTSRTVHSLVCEAFLGPRPDGMEVRHIDGNPSDSRLSNLTYGTPKENQSDRRLHGTQALGTDRHNSKLSYLKAKAVRVLYESGQFGYNDLAEVFDVGTGTIRHIIRGETWRAEDAPPERVTAKAL